MMKNRNSLRRNYTGCGKKAGHCWTSRYKRFLLFGIEIQGSMASLTKPSNQSKYWVLILFNVSQNSLNQLNVSFVVQRSIRWKSIRIISDLKSEFWDLRILPLARKSTRKGAGKGKIMFHAEYLRSFHICRFYMCLCVCVCVCVSLKSTLRTFRLL